MEWRDGQGNRWRRGRHPAVTSRRTVLLAGGTLLPATAAALVACAGVPSTGAPSPSAAPVTLTYFSDWSGGARGEWIKAAFPKFSEENPKITVQPEFAQNDAKAEAIANAAGGTLS